MENNAPIDLDRLTEICIEAGASAARTFGAEIIPFDRALRSYCEANSCGCYGRNYACPPQCGTPEEMIERAKA